MPDEHIFMSDDDDDGGNGDDDLFEAYSIEYIFGYWHRNASVTVTETAHRSAHNSHCPFHFQSNENVTMKLTDSIILWTRSFCREAENENKIKKKIHSFKLHPFLSLHRIHLRPLSSENSVCFALLSMCVCVCFHSGKWLESHYRLERHPKWFKTDFRATALCWTSFVSGTEAVEKSHTAKQIRFVIRFGNSSFCRITHNDTPVGPLNVCVQL